jgi:hypothetical protein
MIKLRAARVPAVVGVAGLAVLLLAVIMLRPYAAGAAEPAGVAASGRTFLPAILKPTLTIQNADFEAGPTGWAATSTDGGAVIRTDQPVAAHSGIWVAWLGGAKNNISTISQQVIVPASAPHLTYYHYIASADVCGFDKAVVFANLTQVANYQLCSGQNTHGWVKKVIDMSAFANQTIALQIRVETDGTLNSNLFVDDVAFQSGPGGAASSWLPGDGNANETNYRSGELDPPAAADQLRRSK